VAKRYIVQQKCLNNRIGSSLLGTQFYSFQSPMPTLCPQTPHLLHRRRWCHVANKSKHMLTALLFI